MPGGIVMADEFLPSVLIKDADFVRIIESLCNELSPPLEASRLANSLKKLRNMFVLSYELRKMAVNNNLQLRLLELLRSSELSQNSEFRTECFLVLAQLHRSNLLNEENFPMQSSEFLNFIGNNLFARGCDEKSVTAGLLSLLHHCSTDPSFLLSINEHTQKNWLSTLLELIRNNENDMETNFKPNTLLIDYVLKVIAQGCRSDPSVREQCGQFDFLINTLEEQLIGGRSLESRISSIDCIAALCTDNAKNASIISKRNKIVPCLSSLTDRNCHIRLQLNALKCLVRICANGKADAPTKRAIITCQNLIRLAKSDRPMNIRIEAVQSLVELTEGSIGLQRIAGQCDNLIGIASSVLASQEQVQCPIIPKKGQENMALDLDTQKTPALISDFVTGPFLEMLATITSNDEHIRRRVSDNQHLVSAIVASVRHANPRPVVLAGLHCLLSLSRSSFQLRTTFADHRNQLATMLTDICKHQSSDEEMLASCLALIANLLLPYGPVKNVLIGNKPEEFIKMFISFSNHSNHQVRINALWSLINMAYQCTSELRSVFYENLSKEHLFGLLSESNNGHQIPMVTLCIIRNLVDGSSDDVDNAVSHYGDQVLQSAVLILEGDYSIDAKEQILRIIANMAYGEKTRDTLLSNDDLLRKVMDYMLHFKLTVQMAAIDALTNLTVEADSTDYAANQKRWQTLESCGFIRVLNEMMTTTSDMSLFIKVKRLIELFSQHRFGITS